MKSRDLYLLLMSLRGLSRKKWVALGSHHKLVLRYRRYSTFLPSVYFAAL